MTILLDIKNLQVGYGQSLVLQDLSLEISEGAIVCLLGANGSGKTTTTRAISGLIAPRSGSIKYAGSELTSASTHDRVASGICLAPEGRQVFPNFTVHENLLLGSYSRRARPRRAEMLDEIYELFPRLAERRRQAAGLMSGGEQQMLAIGRALMGCPRLLILDEPSLGLAPKIIIDVYETIAKVARGGLSILFVEQNLHAAFLIADRGYVLANGRIATSGTAAELRDSELVRDVFLGRKSTSVGTGERHSASSISHSM